MLNFDGYPIKIETIIDFFVKPHLLLVKTTMFFLDLLKRALELLSQEINQREYFIKSFSTKQYIYNYTYSKLSFINDTTRFLGGLKPIQIIQTLFPARFPFENALTFEGKPVNSSRVNLSSSSSWFLVGRILDFGIFQRKFDTKKHMESECFK